MPLVLAERRGALVSRVPPVGGGLLVSRGPRVKPERRVQLD